MQDEILNQGVGDRKKGESKKEDKERNTGIVQVQTLGCFTLLPSERGLRWFVVIKNKDNPKILKLNEKENNIILCNIKMF